MQGMVPYAQGALRLKEYDQLPPHITREQYLNLLNAVERKYSSAGQCAKKAKYYRDRKEGIIIVDRSWGPFLIGHHQPCLDL